MSNKYIFYLIFSYIKGEVGGYALDEQLEQRGVARQQIQSHRPHGLRCQRGRRLLLHRGEIILFCTFPFSRDVLVGQ